MSLSKISCWYIVLFLVKILGPMEDNVRRRNKGCTLGAIFGKHGGKQTVSLVNIV